MQRVVYAPRDLRIRKKKRPICTTAGWSVGLVLRRVSSWVLSGTDLSRLRDRKYVPASWNANRIASDACLLHPKNSVFKSRAMSYQTCGHDPPLGAVLLSASAALLSLVTREDVPKLRSEKSANGQDCRTNRRELITAPIDSLRHTYPMRWWLRSKWQKLLKCCWSSSLQFYIKGRRMSMESVDNLT